MAELQEFVFEPELNKKFAASCYEAVSKTKDFRDLLKELGVLEQSQVFIAVGPDGDKFCRIITPSNDFEVQGCPKLDPGYYNLDVVGNLTITTEVKKTLTEKQCNEMGLNWDWYNQAKPKRQIVRFTAKTGQTTAPEDFLKALLSR